MSDPADLGFTWRKLALFEGSLDAWRGNPKNNDTLFTLAVPPEFKYEAMPMSDHLGKRFRVLVQVAEFDEVIDDAD